MTEPAASPDDVSALANSVLILARRLRQERGSTLSATQLSALGSLGLHGPMMLGALSDRERVRPPSMTRIVASLASEGLVDRSPHPEDGRQVIVAISESGKHRLAEERRRRDQWLVAQLEGLTAREREVLLASAATMRAIAHS